MAAIYPFHALRPPSEKVSEVASVPYDVVNTEEARAIAAPNPLSFLHVTRPEIDMPAGTDIYSDAVYAKAVENLRRLESDCPLERNAEPDIYLYRLVMGEHKQTGLFACFSIDEYDNDLIRKHEKTRPDKENDRTRHVVETRAQTGVVFLTYRPDRRIDALVEAEAKEGPLYDFTAEDGVRHTVWRSVAPEQLARCFMEVPALYIADGHHRAASASRARATLREQNPNHTGREEYNRFVAVAFPADQMKILPYHRVVRDLNGRTPEEFMDDVQGRFKVTRDANPNGPGKAGHWHMYTGGHWYGLMLKRDIADTMRLDDPTSTLDVSLLQDNLLAPILGIRDQRTDQRVDFVGGIRGTAELARLVDSGRAAVAFALYPTAIEDLLRVSDMSAVMPPKSTWFEPKLRDGILIHTI